MAGSATGPSHSEEPAGRRGNPFSNLLSVRIATPGLIDRARNDREFNCLAAQADAAYGSPQAPANPPGE